MLICTNVLTMISINLFCYCGKVFPYEYMDDWEKFNETLSPQKEDFYSHINMKYITDADYTYIKSVHKDFSKLKIKNVQSDTSYLADVFNSFWNMCL